MAAPWPAIQRPDGSLPDYLDAVSDSYGGFPDTRYGNALMGYALLQTGLRERDTEITAAGRRALMFAMSPDGSGIARACSSSWQWRARTT